MAKSYHILQGTSVVGPLQLAELSTLVQKGVVSEHTMVSDDASDWKPAKDLVAHLFGNELAASSSGSTTTGGERWYVQANGQQYGPITYTELLGWVSSKSVVADTLVRKSEYGPWQRADTVFPHLGARSMTTRAAGPRPTASPPTNTPITEEPTVSQDKSRSRRRRSDSSTEAVFQVIGMIALIAVVYVGGFWVVFMGLPQLRAIIGPGWLLVGFLLFYFIRSAISKKGP